MEGADVIDPLQRSHTARFKRLGIVLHLPEPDPPALRELLAQKVQPLLESNVAFRQKSALMLEEICSSKGFQIQVGPKTLCRCLVLTFLFQPPFPKLTRRGHSGKDLIAVRGGGFYMSRRLDHGIQPLRKGHIQRLLQMEALRQAHVVHHFCQTVQLPQSGLIGEGHVPEMPLKAGDGTVDVRHAESFAGVEDGFRLPSELIRGRRQFQACLFVVPRADMQCHHKVFPPCC